MPLRPRRAWPGRALGLAGLLASGLLAACSGTPFGEQLSGSFSAPAAAPSPAPASPTPAPTEPRDPSGAAAPAAPSKPATPAATEARPAPAMAPAPYRITIKLVGADPAAPAEAVTEALRAAGVPFEVEMIERVAGASTPPASAEAPASPPPAAAPAPAARPAPPPR